MENNIECPYCGQVFKHFHEPECGYDERDRFKLDCLYCKKVFQYTIYTKYTYDPIKTDCLNDGKHDLQDGLCKMCGIDLRINRGK